MAPLWLALAFPANTRVGWKRLNVSNTLVYYDIAKVTAVKGFIVEAPDSISCTFRVKILFEVNFKR